MRLELWLFAALFVVAWHTAAGMAVRSVSRIWLRHWAEHQLRGDAADVYLGRPHRLLTAAATGAAVALLVGGIMLGTAEHGLSLLGKSAAFIAVVVVLGQIVPRAIARRWPTAVASATLPVLRLTDLVAAPLATLGRVLARPVLPAAAGSPASADNRESIQDLLREGELEGVGERQEIAIISGVVQFRAKHVGAVMTPRADVFALDAALPPGQMARAIAQSAYSRIPVYRGTPDTVVGLVHAFDVLKTGPDEAPPIRPVAFATPDSPCNELLFRMLRERRHLAVVRDAASRTVGLVTLEDLLEELVGDIRDEHDELTG